MRTILGPHLRRLVWSAAEAESKTSVVNFKISDVLEQLDQHLAKKLEDGADYDEIIVKHYKFDIFKD